MAGGADFSEGEIPGSAADGAFESGQANGEQLDGAAPGGGADWEKAEGTDAPEIYVEALVTGICLEIDVYHDNQGSERIFPFDPVPRVISAAEWEHLEAGLTQRILALLLFLHDVYHDQNILNDEVIPRHYIENAKHFRKEFRGVDVPKDIYIHICGSDLIRGGDGTYYVLEDNGRCCY